MSEMVVKSTWAQYFVGGFLFVYSIRGLCTVEPGVWRRNFPWVLAYKFWYGELLQGHAAGNNPDLSIGRLAVGRSRGIRPELALAGAELIAY